MSRAFVKESDDRPDDEPLPPDSPNPPYVTPDGHELLSARLSELRAEAGAVPAIGDLGDKLHGKRLKRDIRILERKLSRAIVVSPPEDAEEVAFGHWVGVEDDAGNPARYRIVGEDQADPANFWISWVSPLAKALIGAEIGERVVWRRPAGDLGLTVISIEL